VRSSTSCAVALAATLTLADLPATAHVIHVPADQPTIQAGIGAAVSGDTVMVACGTYFETGLVIDQKDIHVVSETLDPACAVIDAMDLSSAFAFRRTTSSLEGFTIRNGFAQVGAGIFVWDASVADIRNCVVLDNYATSAGGGIYVTGSDATIEFTTVARNHAQGGTFQSGGGALYVQAHSIVTVLNCTFVDNTSPQGPGVYIPGTFPTVLLDRCIFANQDCAIWNATFTCCCFRDCAAGGTSFQADPLFCDAPGGDYRLAAGSPCLPDGNACESLLGSEALGCGPADTVRTVITSAPSPATIQVDGTTHVTPVAFDWPLYSKHAVSAGLVPLAPGERLRFDSWSDGGAGAHRIFVDKDSLVFVAGLVRQFELTTTVSGPGTVSPSAGWFDEGSIVPVQATAGSRYYLDRWIGSGAGSYSGSANPATVVMSSAVSEEAVFGAIAFDVSISSSPTDPLQRVAAPANGARLLYLWIPCANAGVSALAAATSGTLLPLAFVPAGGVLNAGSATDLLLAVPHCPAGEEVSLLLGYWVVDDSGGTLCLAPGSTGELAAVDCDEFLSFGVSVAGFSSAGDPPCVVGADVCGTRQSPYSRPDIDAGRGRSIVVHPNPFSDFTEIQLEPGTSVPNRVAIYDVAGRLVRSIASGGRDQAARRLHWDGRSDSGRIVPAGVYFLRIEMPTSTVTHKVTRLAGR
jgi:hypothetical protein